MSAFRLPGYIQEDPNGKERTKAQTNRLSLNLGFLLILDSSAKISSYCLSRYPKMASKLEQTGGGRQGG
jgi:hypothetical protein